MSPIPTEIKVWDDSLPPAWSTAPLWALATCNDEVLAETTDPDTRIRYIEISDVDAVEGIVGEADLLFGAAPSRARRKTREGDVILSTVRTYLRAVAAVDSEYAGSVVSTGFAVIRPRKVHAGYLKHVVSSDIFIENVIARSVGVSYPAINASDVMKLKIPLPPPEDQRRIAAFLDHETARIDELVREQERLRTQLLEKRSAVISASATTGLDDEALTRDSGVAWLGEVSSEWSLVRLLHVSRIRSGLVDPTDERFVDFTLIAPNHVESETGRLLELSTAREQGAISGKYRCYHGDVIYSKIRPALAKACLSPGDEVLCSADMYAIAPGERLLSQFLLLFLLSDAFTRFAVLESDRVAMPKINQESFKDCWIPLPPIHEQQVIVERAFAALKDVDALLDESNRLIDLLLERRAALISAAVTGQLDLRDWQSPELEAVAEVA